MFNVILLAAGASVRMGVPKGLLPLQDTNLLDFQIASIQALPIPIEDIVIVLGYHAKAHKAQCANLIQPPRNVLIATNHQPELGQFSSLKCGLELIHRLRPTPERGAFILPIDCPCPAVGTWKRLADALEKGSWAAIPQTPRGRGHPVALGTRFITKLVASSTESRLDHLIKMLPTHTVSYIKAHDPYISLNLNTPEQWETFRAEFTRTQ